MKWIKRKFAWIGEKMIDPFGELEVLVELFEMVEIRANESFRRSSDSVVRPFPLPDRAGFYARIGETKKAIADYDEAISLHASDA